MSFGLGDIVGKVVEYSTPPAVRMVADAIKPGSGDKISKASGKAAKAIVDSPLTPYGAVKTATETIAKHPKEAANVADKAARVLSPTYGLARAAQEHPEAAGKIADVAARAAIPAYGLARTAQEHPKEAAQVAKVADTAMRFLSPVYGLARTAGEHPKETAKAADIAARVAVPAYGLAKAAAEHPDQAKTVAKTLAWLTMPGLMAAKEGVDAIAKHPAEAKKGLEVSDAITKYLPGGALMQDIRKGIFGF